MITRLQIENAPSDSEWDQFIDSSPTGTAFGKSVYLKASGARLDRLFCLNNQEIRAGILLVRSKDEKNAVLHDFIIYSGVIFGAETNHQNRAQIISERFSIAAFIAETLPNRYRQISFALHPSVVDIRPFLWHNYGTSGPKYHADVRYTSYIDISGFSLGQSPEEIPWLDQLSYSRRQEIRKAAKRQITTEETTDVGMLVDFYRKTMERQGKRSEASLLASINGLIETLLENKAGKLFVSRERDGTPGSMAFFIWDSKRAYYVFGANDPQLRSSPTGSAVLWDSFGHLASQGIREVDLEGVNSPHRGSFKLSFGGILCPYFQLDFPNGPCSLPPKGLT